MTSNDTRPARHRTRQRSPKDTAALAGLIAAIFPALSTVGLTVLQPPSVLGKIFVFSACLALTIAMLTGTAIWRTEHRLAVTAIAGLSATALVTALFIPGIAAPRRQAGAKTPLAALSPARGEPQAGATLGGSPATGPTASSPAHSASPPAGPATPRPTPAPGSQSLRAVSQYLVDATIIKASPGPPATGNWDMQHHLYEHSVGYPELSSHQTVSYLLNGHYSWFQATVGLNDETTPKDQTVPVIFTVIAMRGSVQVNSRTIRTRYGAPQTIVLEISGADTLKIETYPAGAPLTNRDSIAMWGSAGLVA